MNNTMNRYEYIKEHFVWMFVLLVWFVKLFFKNIPGHTYWQTWMIFAGVFVGVSGLGIAVTFKRGRNYYNLIQNLICTWGAFILLAYWEQFTRKIILIMSIALGLSVAGIALILLRRIQRPHMRRRIIRSRLYRCVKCFRGNVCAALLAIIVLAGVLMSRAEAAATDALASVPMYGEAYSMTANMETLVKLKEDVFCELNTEEKLEICKVVCQVEARYLGIETQINVSSAQMDEKVLGCYSHESHTVYINNKHLENGSSYAIVTTCLHEMYHSYQHRLVESYYQVDPQSRNLLMYREIADYIEEMKDYKTGLGESKEDFYDYYTQDMEVMARAYSEDGVKEYFERIEKYLEEKAIE